MKRRWVFSVALGLVAAGVAVGTLVPGAGQWLPFYAPLAAHLAAFTLIGMLARFAMPKTRWAMSAALVLALALGIVAETMQLLVARRTFSLPDLSVNVAGAVLGVLIGSIVLIVVSRMGFFDAARVSGRSSPSKKNRRDESFGAELSQAGSLARQVSRLSDDRLLAAWPMLLDHGHISREQAVLAENIQRARRTLANPPAGDRRVLEAMEAAGVRCLLLKGTLLAHTVYDEPDQRERGDTDILVAPEDRQAAEAVLEQQGLARSWSVTAKTSDTQDQWQGRVDSMPLVIDLHWQLLNHPAFSALFDFDELWARHASVEVNGAAAAGLQYSDALLHAVLHYFAHHGDEFRPAQWLFDMDLLWRAMGQEDRDQLIRRAEELGISGLVSEAMRLTQERFRTPISPETLIRLKESGKRQWRTGLLKTGSGPLSDQIFKLRAIRGWRGRLAHLKALLFPSREYMWKKYPGSSRWALPWLYVKRMVGGGKG